MTKRKRTTRKTRQPWKKKGKASNKRTINKMIKTMINRNIETKTGLNTPTDGLEIYHNNFVVISSNPLATQVGAYDQAYSMGQRIGDDINLRGVSIKFMAELNERYSDVTFRFMVVKSAKGDTPTTATLFNGISGNKMIDTFNSERFTIIASKYFKIRAPNAGNNNTSVIGTGSGAVTSAGYDSNNTLSRATRIVKMYIPGSKFVRNGRVVYENGSEQVKFFDYHMLLYAYSNYSSVDSGPTTYYVARLNDAVIQLYYKDA